MKVATGTKIEVGVRELKNNLSRYLDRISNGEEIVVTDRGRPVARLTAVDAPTHRLAALVASGAVQPPSDRSRHRPARRVTATGSVSGLVAEQRR